MGRPERDEDRKKKRSRLEGICSNYNYCILGITGLVSTGMFLLTFILGFSGAFSFAFLRVIHVVPRLVIHRNRIPYCSASRTNKDPSF